MGTMAGVGMGMRAELSKADRPAGRVEVATRRAENLRTRLNSALGSAHGELDRLVGSRLQPAERNGNGLVPVQPTSDAARLEAEVDMLEATLSYAEDLLARLAAV